MHYSAKQIGLGLALVALGAIGQSVIDGADRLEKLDRVVPQLVKQLQATQAELAHTREILGESNRGSE